MCSIVPLSDEVIKQRLSLIWVIYLETSLQNCNNVESLILHFMVSTNAILFLWMLLQMIQRSKGASFLYSCRIRLMMIMQKSSVIEPSNKWARTLALNIR